MSPRAERAGKSAREEGSVGLGGRLVRGLDGRGRKKDGERGRKWRSGKESTTERTQTGGTENCKGCAGEERNERNETPRDKETDAGGRKVARVDKGLHGMRMMKEWAKNESSRNDGMCRPTIRCGGTTAGRKREALAQGGDRGVKLQSRNVEPRIMGGKEMVGWDERATGSKDNGVRGR
ncbi:hypothetical protein DFH09DRAFT_1074650 [Mycena vulgaris]|nr:hypothetical protein DFH09DRAFT_1074650 [Mycena vulgaris]